MSALTRRIAQGFGANAISQIIAFGQLLVVPIYWRIFGQELYGEWLIISAIPAQLMISDLGFGEAAGNEMTMRASRGDTEGANSAFQSAWAAVSVITLALLLPAVAISWLTPWTDWLNLSQVDASRAPWIGTLMVIQVAVSIQVRTLFGIYRCDGRYARGVMTSNMMRLAGIGGALLALLVWQTVFAVAAAMAVTATVSMALIAWDARRGTPWIGIGLKHATWSEAKRLLSPGLAFLAFAFGTSLSLQWMLTIIGIVLGPASVSVFDTLRKISRLLVQASATMTYPFTVEFSTALGKGDMSLASRLHRQLVRINLWICLLGTAALAALGPIAYRVLSNGDPGFTWSVFGLLLGGAFVLAMWQSSGSVPFAVNRHQKITAATIVVYGIAIMAAIPAMRAFGLEGAAAVQLIAELILLIVVVGVALRMTEDTWQGAAKALTSNPMPELRRAFSRLRP